jgi:hypothetical protein
MTTRAPISAAELQSTENLLHGRYIHPNNERKIPIVGFYDEIDSHGLYRFFKIRDKHEPSKRKRIGRYFQNYPLREQIQILLNVLGIDDDAAQDGTTYAHIPYYVLTKYFTSNKNNPNRTFGKFFIGLVLEIVMFFTYNMIRVQYNGVNEFETEEYTEDKAISPILSPVIPPIPDPVSVSVPDPVPVSAKAKAKAKAKKAK